MELKLTYDIEKSSGKNCKLTFTGEEGMYASIQIRSDMVMGQLRTKRITQVAKILPEEIDDLIEGLQKIKEIYKED